MNFRSQKSDRIPGLLFHLTWLKSIQNSHGTRISVHENQGSRKVANTQSNPILTTSSCLKRAPGREGKPGQSPEPLGCKYRWIAYVMERMRRHRTVEISKGSPQSIAEYNLHMRMRYCLTPGERIPKRIRKSSTESWRKLQLSLFSWAWTGKKKYQDLRGNG